jgi:DNA-binding Xre family transcriptional regulator
MRRLRNDHLPVAPVLPLLREYHAKRQRLLATSEFSLRRLSDETGISERALSRWMSGESQFIQLDSADRLALALGQTLFRIWHWTDGLGRDPQEIRCAGPGCPVMFFPSHRGQRLHHRACKQAAYRLRHAL